LLCLGGLPSCGGDSSPTQTTQTQECPEFSDHTTSAYILPYSAGQGYRVSLTLEHPAAELRYAIDFDMPIGTPIIAARSGTVVDLEESFRDGDRSGSENFLLVEHEDGTVARYVHLTRNGALAEIGDSVTQGDVIALSGDTGRSNQPHLHFDVIPCCCVAPPAVTGPPCDQTMPLTFRNTRAHACGLVVGGIYFADP
jgi:murein DD-endopeptidase MepM/ murein hydrolase activator NlpD